MGRQAEKGMSWGVAYFWWCPGNAARTAASTAKIAIYNQLPTYFHSLFSWMQLRKLSITILLFLSIEKKSLPPWVAPRNRWCFLWPCIYGPSRRRILNKWSNKIPGSALSDPYKIWNFDTTLYGVSQYVIRTSMVWRILIKLPSYMSLSR